MNANKIPRRWLSKRVEVTKGDLIAPNVQIERYFAWAAARGITVTVFPDGKLNTNAGFHRILVDKAARIFSVDTVEVTPEQLHDYS